MHYFIWTSLHPGKDTSKDVALWASCQKGTQSLYLIPSRKQSLLGLHLSSPTTHTASAPKPFSWAPAPLHLAATTRSSHYLGKAGFWQFQSSPTHQHPNLTRL